MAKKLTITKATAAEIRRLGAEAVEQDGEGNPITRDEALARYLWKLSLPREEFVIDKSGSRVKKSYDPEKWAIELIMDRKEGKAPTAVADDHAGPSVADRVRQLSVDRLNAVATRVTAKGPPKFKPKEIPDGRAEPE